MSTQNCFPKVAVGAVIFDENKILLVKRSNPPAKGKWAVPGGKVMAGENLQYALKREILEETGFNIKVGEIAHVFDVIERDDSQIQFHYVIIDYLCEITGGTLVSGDDALEARWCTANDISTMDVSKHTVNLLKQKYNFL